MAVAGPTKLFHRFPFVLTDRGVEARADGASACRLLSIDDALGEGGLETTYGQSLLVEAMAQTAALFAEDSGRKESGMLVGLRRVSFGRAPRAGDRLLIEATLVQKFGDLVRVAARVTESPDHQGAPLAEGEILISLAGGAGPLAGEDGDVESLGQAEPERSRGGPRPESGTIEDIAEPHGRNSPASGGTVSSRSEDPQS